MEAREISSAAAAECFALSLRDTGHCVGGSEVLRVFNFDIDTVKKPLLWLLCFDFDCKSCLFKKNIVSIGETLYPFSEIIELQLFGTFM